MLIPVGVASRIGNSRAKRGVPTKYGESEASMPLKIHPIPLLFATSPLKVRRNVVRIRFLSYGVCFFIVKL